MGTQSNNAGPGPNSLYEGCLIVHWGTVGSLGTEGSDSLPVMRLACPMDERLHLLVWWALPAAGGEALSAMAEIIWLGRGRPRIVRRAASSSVR